MLRVTAIVIVEGRPPLGHPAWLLQQALPGPTVTDSYRIHTTSAQSFFAVSLESCGLCNT
jgi:hypothetical protein